MNYLKRIIRLIINPKLIYINTTKVVRKLHYKILSDSKNVKGKPIIYQPLLLKGPGKIEFGRNVKFGVEQASGFYSSYCFINARKPEAKIVFGNDIWINNCFNAVSEGDGILIGSKTIIGTNVTIIDTDFHHLDPDKRMHPGYVTKVVNIGKNVWIGNNVTILKGVAIGDNTVISSGAIVTNSIPENVVAGGIPAKVIKAI